MRRYNRGASDVVSRLSAFWPVQSPLLLIGLLISFSAANALGNMLEFEDVDTLPQVENMVFTASSVGIVSKDGRHFVLDRQTQDLQQVDEPAFTQQFLKPWPPKPYEQLQGKEVLRSSAGQEFEQTPASCSEGLNEAHELRYQQRHFPDVLKRCTSVATLEIIGNHLWFGTIRTNEGGVGPAEAVVVQSLSKKQKVTAITSKSGLTGGQIRILRDDPFTKTVWVATEWGLNRIDRRFHVVWGRYWHDEFEPSSRKSQTLLSTSRKTSNPFAVLGRELAVQDWVVFTQAIEKISPVGQNKFRLYEFHMSGFAPRRLAQEMNGLVPFFIDAAQSKVPAVHDFGLRNLCKFDDPRVQTFMVKLATETAADSADERYAQECLKASSAPVP